MILSNLRSAGGFKSLCFHVILDSHGYSVHWAFIIAFHDIFLGNLGFFHGLIFQYGYISIHFWVEYRDTFQYGLRDLNR